MEMVSFQHLTWKPWPKRCQNQLLPRSQMPAMYRCSRPGQNWIRYGDGPATAWFFPPVNPQDFVFLFVFVWLGDLQKLRQFGSLHGWYSVYSIVTNSIYVFIHVHTVHNFLERPWIHSKNPLGTLWDWNKIERYRGAWQSGSSLAQVDSVNSVKTCDVWRLDEMFVLIGWRGRGGHWCCSQFVLGPFESFW